MASFAVAQIAFGAIEAFVQRAAADAVQRAARSAALWVKQVAPCSDIDVGSGLAIAPGVAVTRTALAG
jgi:hypothetical protein